jgi:hypothetical protein
VTKIYTQAQFDEEYASFKRSPEWELKNIVKALSMLMWMNTTQQEARIAAVKLIQKERRAAKRAAVKA